VTPRSINPADTRIPASALGPESLCDFVWRGRPLQVPQTGESIGEKRPDKPLTVLDGVDLVRHRWRDDNVMGDRAPRIIPASLEVRESQRNMAADVSARG
jgi:hypothetical protein